MVLPLVRLPLFLAVSALLAGCGVVDDVRPVDRAEIRAPYVGQGAGVLVRIPGFLLAFDAGPDSSSVLARGLGTEDERIDLLVVSHWDLDHVGGLDTLVAEGRVRRVLFGTAPDDPWMAGKMRAWCGRIPEGCRQVQAGGALDLGRGFRIEFIGPDPGGETSNERGLVARLVAPGGQGILLAPGDIDTVVEARLVASRVPLRASVLLVGHHGSRGSSSLPFLGAVSAGIALVQAGVSNRYGHPHVEALERLRLAVPDLRRILPGNGERLVWEAGAVLDAGVR